MYPNQRGNYPYSNPRGYYQGPNQNPPPPPPTGMDKTSADFLSSLYGGVARGQGNRNSDPSALYGNRNSGPRKQPQQAPPQQPPQQQAPQQPQPQISPSSLYTKRSEQKKAPAKVKSDEKKVPTSQMNEKNSTEQVKTKGTTNLPNYASPPGNNLLEGVDQAFGAVGLGFMGDIKHLRKWKDFDESQIPEGYELVSDGYGQVLQKKETDDEKLEAAANEHKAVKLSVFATMSKIEKAYGLGVYLYFDFVRYVIFINFVLSLIQGINYVTHWIADIHGMVTGPSNTSFFAYVYFVITSSEYGASTGRRDAIRILWQVTNIIAIFVTFLFGPLYFLWVTCLFKLRKLKDNESIADGSKLDIIPENAKVRFFPRLVRNVVVFLVIMIILTVEFGILFALSYAEGALFNNSTRENRGTNDTIMFWVNTAVGLVVSVAITIMNTIMRKLAVTFTKFQKHKTYSRFKRSATFKLVFFRVANVFVMGIAKAFVRDTYQCPLRVVAQQYLTLMLVDVVVMNVVQFFEPFVKKILKKLIATIRRKEVGSGRQSDSEMKNEFNLTEEYLEIIYRQFVIYMAMPVMPIAPFFGFIGGFAEMFVDKVRLLKFSRKPPVTNSSMKRTLVFFLLFIAAAAAFNIGAGSIYFLNFFGYWCDINQPVDDKCSTACTIFSTSKPDEL